MAASHSPTTSPSSSGSCAARSTTRAGSPPSQHDLSFAPPPIPHYSTTAATATGYSLRGESSGFPRSSGPPAPPAIAADQRARGGGCVAASACAGGGESAGSVLDSALFVGPGPDSGPYLKASSSPLGLTKPIVVNKAQEGSERKKKNRWLSCLPQQAASRFLGS
ncbi:hypothetical protein DAI22_04g125000 [Oryza sativa Japonica Group]|nr:hypothetical protein DAI22_04g125000 [Oryza sativa Japonica Group]